MGREGSRIICTFFKKRLRVRMYEQGSVVGVRKIEISLPIHKSPLLQQKRAGAVYNQQERRRASDGGRARKFVGCMRCQVLQQYSQFSVLQVVMSGINHVDGKQLLLLMQLQEQQRRSRRICAWSGPQNDNWQDLYYPPDYFGNYFKYVKWLYKKTSTMILQTAC